MKKLTEQDKEAIYDACDLYGFTSIKYAEETDTMYIFYGLRSKALIVKDELYNYISKRCPNYNWCVMAVEEWNKRRPMPKTNNIFDMWDWGEGV